MKRPNPWGFSGWNLGENSTATDLAADRRFRAYFWLGWEGGDSQPAPHATNPAMHCSVGFWCRILQPGSAELAVLPCTPGISLPLTPRQQVVAAAAAVAVVDSN